MREYILVLMCVLGGGPFEPVFTQTGSSFSAGKVKGYECVPRRVTQEKRARQRNAPESPARAPFTRSFRVLLLSKQGPRGRPRRGIRKTSRSGGSDREDLAA